MPSAWSPRSRADRPGGALSFASSAAAAPPPEDEEQTAVPPAAQQPQQPEQQAFSTGARKVVRLGGRRMPGSAASLMGVVHITNSSNNIILTLTDPDGAVKAWTSAGTVGFKNARKNLPVAAEKAAEELARRAIKLGYGSVTVQMKGVGKNKQYAVQSLAAAGLALTRLVDVTPIPYNGCRRPKRRRV